MKKNVIIREAAQKHGLYLWEVAEACGYNDANFSRKLRHELPDAEQKRIIGIIETLAKEAKDNG